LRAAPAEATLSAMTKKAAAPELAIITFATPAKFEAWLAKHHDDLDGAWLRLAKKDAAERR